MLPELQDMRHGQILESMHLILDAQLTMQGPQNDIQSDLNTLVKLAASLDAPLIESRVLVGEAGPTLFIVFDENKVLIEKCIAFFVRSVNQLSDDAINWENTTRFRQVLTLSKTYESDQQIEELATDVMHELVGDALLVSTINQFQLLRKNSAQFDFKPHSPSYAMIEHCIKTVVNKLAQQRCLPGTPSFDLKFKNEVSAQSTTLKKILNRHWQEVFTLILGVKKVIAGFDRTDFILKGRDSISCQLVLTWVKNLSDFIPPFGAAVFNKDVNQTFDSRELIILHDLIFQKLTSDQRKELYLILAMVASDYVELDEIEDSIFLIQAYLSILPITSGMTTQHFIDHHEATALGYYLLFNKVITEIATFNNQPQGADSQMLLESIQHRLQDLLEAMHHNLENLYALLFFNADFKFNHAHFHFLFMQLTQLVNNLHIYYQKEEPAVIHLINGIFVKFGMHYRQLPDEDKKASYNLNKSLTIYSTFYYPLEKIISSLIHLNTSFEGVKFEGNILASLHLVYQKLISQGEINPQTAARFLQEVKVILREATVPEAIFNMVGNFSSFFKSKHSYLFYLELRFVTRIKEIYTDLIFSLHATTAIDSDKMEDLDILARESRELKEVYQRVRNELLSQPKTGISEMKALVAELVSNMQNTVSANMVSDINQCINSISLLEKVDVVAHIFIKQNLPLNDELKFYLFRLIYDDLKVKGWSHSEMSQATYAMILPRGWKSMENYVKAFVKTEEQLGAAFQNYKHYLAEKVYDSVVVSKQNQSKSKSVLFTTASCEKAINLDLSKSKQQANLK